MATTKKTAVTYDEDSIEVLDFPDAVRKKTSFYIGPTDESGVWTIVREAADNAVDEALAERNNFVHIHFGKTDKGLPEYWVRDNGAGIPVKPKKFKDVTLPTIEAILTRLHSSGKFHDKAYSIARGSHGLGLKATNALSTEFEVFTFRDGSWYSLQYSKGIKTRDLKKCRPPVSPASGKPIASGTVIRVVPDKSIFSSLNFSPALAIEWAQVSAYFTPKFKVLLTSHKGSKKEIYYPEGPKAFTKDRVEKLKCTPLSPDVFVYSSALCDCVAQFTDYDGTELKAFTNGLHNAEGGVHYNAFFAALKKAIDPHIKVRQEFTINELKEGVVGLINAKLSAPNFDSQTKEKLVDDRADKPLHAMLVTELTKFFASNKALAHKICARCFELKNLKNKFVASKNVLKEIRRVTSLGFPSKATTSPHAKPDQRELFLVEGDSAGGCFVKNTRIQLINGQTKTLGQLVSDSKRGLVNYGFAHSNKTGVHVVPIDQPRLVKYTRCLIEVRLDNGAVVRCTRDHKWKLRTGEYREAQDLKVGDSLMPYIEDIFVDQLGNQRRLVHSPGFTPNGKPTLKTRKDFVYRLVADAIPSLRNKVKSLKAQGNKVNLHHKDFNSLNDHPSNIEPMVERDHRILHSIRTSAFANFKKGKKNIHAILMRTNPEYAARVRARSKEFMSEFWGREENRRQQSIKATKHYADPVNREKASRLSKDWWTPERRKAQSEKASRDARRPGFKERSNASRLEKRKAKLQQVLDLVRGPLNDDSFREAQEKWAVEHGHKRLPFKNLDKARLVAEGKLNHSVVSVRSISLKKGVPVYDASIRKYHNYALAAGVFVHNTARQARDGSYQEILPLRGKILNALKHTDERVLLSEEVLNILAMIGFDPKASNPYDKLRVGKIICLSDPDPDGPLHGDTPLNVATFENDDVKGEPIWHRVTMVELATQEWLNRKYYVNAYNGKTFVLAQAHSSRVTEYGSKQITLGFENGKKIICSPSHQFALASQRYDQRVVGQLANGMQMIRADRLKTGDRLCQPLEMKGPNASNSKMTVLGITRCKVSQCGPTPWYCLTVPTYHNFVLECGVVSKNCHINSLILTLLFKYLPDLFKRGIVYAAQTPEFYSVAGGRLFGGSSPSDVEAQLARAKVKGTARHIKGYGEIDPDILRVLAFEPSTRRVVKITSLEKSRNQEFIDIMGEGSAGRRILLGI